MVSPTVESQVDVLRRIVARGKSYSYNAQDSRALDLWQHMEDELERLRIWMDDYP